MIKIAVASEEEMVSGHFGHCGNFNIFLVEEGQIVGHENIKSPGHDSGSLPDFLKTLDVEVVISGGMGQGAIDGCTGNQMEVVSGATGKAEDAVLAFLDGTLVSSNAVCTSHDHKDGCSGHHND